MKHQMGTFRIGHDVITESPGLVLEVMARVIVVRAEAQWATKDIEYVGISEDFDVVPDGDRIPAYNLIATCVTTGEGDDVKHELHFDAFVRQPDIVASTFRLDL